MSNSNTIQVAITIDKNYLPYAATMLVSLLVNTPSVQFDIYIIHKGLNTQKKAVLLKNLANYDVKCYFIEIKNNIFNNAIISHHISVATYWRLLLPHLLPQNLQKVLFLDADIIVRKSIQELWDTPIDNYCHAAVEDLGKFQEIKKKLNMANQSPYFNAGVMLINLEFWRKAEITKKAIAFIQNNSDKITLWDQDILNHFFENQWLPVSPIWNAHAFFFVDTPPDTQPLHITQKDSDNVRTNPSIVHFTGSDKPWFIENTHPFKNDYNNFLSLTTWKNMPLKSRKQSITKRIWKKLWYYLSINKLKKW